MVCVENLFFSYEANETPVIKGMSFEVREGEIFGLLGPSGAGKTTTQKIMTGLLKSYQGSVQLFGKNLKHWDRSFYENIGVSFEFPYHYNKLTALENLKYFASLYKDKGKDTAELIEMVNLTDSADKEVGSFSKGMKNRLSFARALQHNPKMLFLDEPTSGLDPVNARRIKDLILDEKAAGKTILLATHDMTVASELCDRVAFLVDGELPVVDKPEKLKIAYGQPFVSVQFQSGSELLTEVFPFEKLGENKRFFNILNEKNVRSIHSKDATLEEIFIKVTGRSLS